MKTLEQAQTLQENVVSSLWIAKVSGKKHKNILAKIKTHISNPTELTYLNKKNNKFPYIELTEEQALKFFKTFVEDDIQLKLINSLRAFKGLELLTELEAEEGEIRNKIIKVNNDLTIFEDIEEPLVSHKIIAEQIFEYDERSKGDNKKQLKDKTKQIKELLEDYLEDFKEMSDDNTVKFKFESEIGGAPRERIETATMGDLNTNKGLRGVGRQRIETAIVRDLNKEKTYFLNEGQATLLFTYFRNTPKVRQFKKALVKEFLRMRDYIKNDVKQLKDELNQTKEQLNDLEKENTKLIQEKSIIQQERDIAYREAGIRLNDYDDNFKTLSRLIKENNLEKEFTPHVLNKLLVEQGLAEAIERKTDVTVFKFTEHTRHAPPNRETKKASNLVHKDYFIDTLIPLAREKGIRRTSRFIAKTKEGLQETIDKKVTDEITDIVTV